MPAVLEAYRTWGLSTLSCEQLAHFARLLVASPVNVISARSVEEIETRHFLDCLELLALPELHHPGARVVDIGTGGGLPALVLAIALPGARVTAVESIRKKCLFLERAVDALALPNVVIEVARAEELALAGGRERFDVAVTRAVGPLHQVAELSVPLLKVGGMMVAMKGRLDDSEWREGCRALAILGVDHVEQLTTVPFPEARHHRLVIGRKVRPTPAGFPRRGAALNKPPRFTSAAVTTQGERGESS